MVGVTISILKRFCAAICLCFFVGGNAFGAGLLYNWASLLDEYANNTFPGIYVDSSGNSFVSGITKTSPSDAILQKRDSLGTTVWSRTWGSPQFDSSKAAVVDPSGVIFAVGGTGGALGGPQQGQGDALLTRLNDNGIALTHTQFGSAFSDGASCVALDQSGNAYFAGLGFGTQSVGNGFVAKCNSAGALQWAHDIGATPLGQDFVGGIAADEIGNAYVAETRYVFKPTGGGDSIAVLRKFDSAGNETWQRQISGAYFESSADVARGADGGIFVAGSGPAGMDDLSPTGSGFFLRKYGANGDAIWTRQLDGTFGYPKVAADALGHVYLSGTQTTGARCFIARFDLAGNLQWKHSFDWFDTSSPLDIAVDSTSVYVGVTCAEIVSPNPPQQRTYLIKFAVEIPEPSANLLGLAPISCMLALRRHSNRQAVCTA